MDASHNPVARIYPTSTLLAIGCLLHSHQADDRRRDDSPAHGTWAQEAVRASASARSHLTLGTSAQA